MLSFENDYSEGAHEKILQEIYGNKSGESIRIRI